ncbi:MAG: HRDC domain-containing protein [Syntrophobacteraceae bacterium]
MRTWRNATAKAANLSSFMILSNKAISHIAFIRPRTTGDLLKAYGFGPSKVAQFGGEILDIVKSVVPAETVERDAKCLGAASTNGAWKEPSQGRRVLKGEQNLPSRAYAPWSPTQDQELKRLHGEGKPSAAIGTATWTKAGCHYLSVRQIGSFVGTPPSLGTHWGVSSTLWAEPLPSNSQFCE